MKKYLVCFFLLNTTFLVLSGQPDFLMKKCITSVGPSSKIIKDFNIQLGEKNSPNEFRYKANLSLRKRTTYRFTMCTADNSKGQLILDIRDQTNKTALSSFDQNTGTIYPYVDFVCNKSGVYQICFDFTGGQSGSGVSIVSIIQ
jgi:hypothetical protein